MISALILHRHGARGPGASELGPWEKSNEIVSQWNECDIENITSVGKKQMIALGKMFALRYAIEMKKQKEKDFVFFRCSKSSRAAESGLDFIKSLNHTVAEQLVSETPTSYSVSADYYFRSWKVNLNISKKMKSKKDSKETKIKAEENKEFIRYMCEKLNVKNELENNLAHAFWSTTHINNIAECEHFFPVEDGVRNALTLKLSTLSTDFFEDVRRNALWVLNERFFNVDYSVELGSWLFLDMIQACFNPQYGLSVFSAHDYTIMSVLSSTKLLSGLVQPVQFGAYIILELWDVGDDRVLKVILNSSPFDVRSGPALPAPVFDIPCNTANEVLLAELTIDQVRTLVTELCATLRQGELGLPPDFAVPVI